MTFETVALKRVAAINMGQSPPSESYNAVELGLPFLQGNAEFGDLHPTPRLWCPDPPKQCQPGDILLSVRAPVGAKNIADGVYGVGRGLCAVTPQNVHPRFLWYATDVVIGELLSTAQGSTYTAVIADDVAQARVPLPHLDEQAAIADFLDRETIRIDGVIAARKRLIPLLQTRRRAYADDLVSNGDGRRARVKSVVTRITSGPRGWARYVSSSGDPFIRIANLSRESIELRRQGLIHVAAPPGQEAERTRTAEGDVVVSITADVGSVGVVGSGFANGYVSQHLALLRPNRIRIDPRWLALSLFSSLAQKQLDESRYGGTKTQLSLDDVAEVRLTLPPLARQRTSVQQWSETESILTRLTDEVTYQIRRLEERRRALITTAVSGIPNRPTSA